MDGRNKHLFADLILLTVSIIFAIFIAKTGLAEDFARSFNGYWWLGIIFAGLFFTSIFTAASSVVLLSMFATTTDLLPLAILGGIGATIGDYVIFLFVKDRISKDLEYLMSLSREKRLSMIIKTQLFKFFAPFIGALIIATPIPDELGVAMLGLSRISNKLFLVLVFCLHFVGIFTLGWVAQNIVQ